MRITDLVNLPEVKKVTIITSAVESEVGTSSRIMLTSPVLGPERFIEYECP